MVRGATFVREDVVRAAMEVFWRDGYLASSLASLGAAMDLQPGSIYAAFGSKDGLFREALAAYVQRVRSTVARAQLGPREIIEGWFAAHIDAALDVPEGARGRGCLLLRSAAESGHLEEETAAQVREAVDAMERFFRSAVIKIRRQHDRDSDSAGPAATARLLVATLAGIDSLSRLGASRKVLEDAARAALATI